MYLILIASLILETGAVVPCEKSTSLSLHLCSTASKYDRSFPYEGPPGNPTEIANSIALHSVAQVKEDEDMITLNLLLSAWWNDTRLTLKQHGKSIQDGFFYEMENEDIEKTYFPSMKFKSSESVIRIKKFGPFAEDFYWLETPHLLDYQQEFKVTLYCNFDFTKYPFDSHDCNITFGLASNSHLRAILRSTKIRYKGEVHSYGDAPIEKRLTKAPYDIRLESMSPFLHFEAGYVYSYAGMKMHLKRNSLGLLLGGFYGPTAIFTILSLISFSIDPDVVPGRLGLLVTLYLICSNVYNSLKAPKKRGFSYLEIWNVGVQIPILLAIFEYGFILTWKRCKKIGNANKVFDLTTQEDKEKNLKKTLKKVDAWTFNLSLGFMTLFNLVYWSIAFSTD